VRVGEEAVVGSVVGPGVGFGVGFGVDQVADAAGRLAAARGLLRRLEDRAAGARPVVEPGADGRLLPVVPPLTELLGGGLRRGSTVAVSGGAGSTSLLLALLAQASAAGAWAGVVGRPELGLVAAAEAGVALERLTLVPYPGVDLVGVTSALLDGLDLVSVACPEKPLRAADRQRLVARARHRGAVLLPLGPWPGAEVELSCVPMGWQGVGNDGGGRLCARRVDVQVRGRGVTPGGRSARLLLPGPDGRPAADGVAAAAGRASLEDREAG
jgi:hypothetical protein